MLQTITTTQFLIRMEDSFVNGVLDLRDLDLRNVDMRKSKVRELFTRLTRMASFSKGQKDLCIDMTNSNISGRDFSNYDLSKVVLSGVTAEHTIFTNSNLTDVQLDGANVQYCDFRKADLSFTKLYNTKIDGANFNFANLENTYGLGFGAGGKKVIERLGVASNITGAKLPTQIEDLRNDIISEINNHLPDGKKINNFDEESDQRNHASASW